MQNFVVSLSPRHDCLHVFWSAAATLFPFDFIFCWCYCFATTWYEGPMLAEEHFCPPLVVRSTYICFHPVSVMPLRTLCVSAADLLTMPSDQHNQSQCSLKKGEGCKFPSDNSIWFWKRMQVAVSVLFALQAFCFLLFLRAVYGLRTYGVTDPLPCLPLYRSRSLQKDPTPVRSRVPSPQHAGTPGGDTQRTYAMLQTTLHLLCSL